MVNHANDSDFENKIAEGPVVVDFWASWCMPCQMFGPVFEEASKDMEGKAEFIKVSTEEAPKTAEKMGIMSIPSVVFFKDGKEMHRVTGMMTKQALIDEVNKLL